jgi:hypothetical protein
VEIDDRARGSLRTVGANGDVADRVLGDLGDRLGRARDQPGLLGVRAARPLDALLTERRDALLARPLDRDGDLGPQRQRSAPVVVARAPPRGRMRTASMRFSRTDSTRIEYPLAATVSPRRGRRPSSANTKPPTEL